MQVAADALRPEFRMLLDLTLALVPLVLAIWLFRPGHYRGLLWWPGVVVFILFLPNAPYVLTDVLHLVEKVRERPPLPIWAVGLLVLPEYGLYFLAGLQSYTISLLLLRSFLRRHGRGHWVRPMEWTLHLLCGYGVYLGRFLRLNSWDVVYRTEAVARDVAVTLEQPHALLVVGVSAAVLGLLYHPVWFVDEAVWDRWHGPRPDPHLRHHHHTRVAELHTPG